MKMRYALRNQAKIKVHFEPHGQEVLDRIINSLDKHFERDNPLQESEDSDTPPYKMIIINDTGHTCACISFYILGVSYDVVRLAFNEFIG